MLVVDVWYAQVKNWRLAKLLRNSELSFSVLGDGQKSKMWTAPQGHPQSPDELDVLDRHAAHGTGQDEAYQEHSVVSTQLGTFSMVGLVISFGFGTIAGLWAARLQLRHPKS